MAGLPGIGHAVVVVVLVAVIAQAVQIVVQLFWIREPEAVVDVVRYQVMVVVDRQRDGLRTVA